EVRHVSQPPLDPAAAAVTFVTSVAFADGCRRVVANAVAAPQRIGETEPAAARQPGTGFEQFHVNLERQPLRLDGAVEREAIRHAFRLSADLAITVDANIHMLRPARPASVLGTSIKDESRVAVLANVS